MRKQIIASIAIIIILALTYFIPYFKYALVIAVIFIFSYSKKDEENTYR